MKKGSFGIYVKSLTTPLVVDVNGGLLHVFCFGQLKLFLLLFSRQCFVLFCFFQFCFFLSSYTFESLLLTITFG